MRSAYGWLHSWEPSALGVTNSTKQLINILTIVSELPEARALLVQWGYEANDKVTLFAFCHQKPIFCELV